MMWKNIQFAKICKLITSTCVLAYIAMLGTVTFLFGDVICRGLRFEQVDCVPLPKKKLPAQVKVTRRRPKTMIGRMC